MFQQRTSTWVLRLSAATVVLVASVCAVSADIIGDLKTLLLKFEPISDGSLTTDDPLPFGHTIHVVDRDNKDSWKIDQFNGVVTFEDSKCDALETPLQAGALHLVVNPGDGWARLRSTRYHRTFLRDLTRLDYLACDHMNNGQQWPYLLLDIDWDGNNSIDDLIFFEPAYQNPGEGGTCGVGSNQGPELYDKWQFWDGLRTDPTTGEFRACYWAGSSPLVGGVGTTGCGPGVFVCSLSEYIAQHPNAAIINVDGNHGGVQIVHGFASASDRFDGWADAFTIGKDINGSDGQTYNSTITYDFQKP